MQNRLLLAVLSGCFLLSNLSSALGMLLMSFLTPTNILFQTLGLKYSSDTAADADGNDHEWYYLYAFNGIVIVECLLALVIQTFSVFIGSV